MKGKETSLLCFYVCISADLQKKCPVRLVNFAREEMELSFGYLKERMFIRRASADDKPLVYTTGIGGSQFMKRIQDEFNVR